MYGESAADPAGTADGDRVLHLPDGMGEKGSAVAGDLALLGAGDGVLVRAGGVVGIMDELKIIGLIVAVLAGIEIAAEVAGAVGILLVYR